MPLNDNKFEVTVIVLALNEEHSILDVIMDTLRAFDRYKLKGEILVVNDGSTDGTEMIVDNLMKTEKRVHMIKHTTPQGIGYSFWDGVDNALGEAVVALAGDNENYPEEILRYYKLLDDVDIIVPFVINKEVRSPLRNFLSFLYRIIINYTFHTNFNYTNGNVLYRKSVLNNIKYRCSEVFFQTINLVTFVENDYLFAEVPYRLRGRKDGESKVITFKSLRRIMRSYLLFAKDFYLTKRIKIDKAFPEDSATAARRINART